MRSILFTVFFFLVLKHEQLLVMGQTSGGLVMNTPMSLTLCQNASLTWTNAPPGQVYVSVVPGGKPNDDALKTFDKVDGSQGSVLWLVDQPAGTSVTILIRDSTGKMTGSAAVTVNKGVDASCLKGSDNKKGTSNSTQSTSSDAKSGSNNNNPPSSTSKISNSTSEGSISHPAASSSSPSSSSNNNATTLQSTTAGNNPTLAPSNSAANTTLPTTSSSNPPSMDQPKNQQQTTTTTTNPSSSSSSSNKAGRVDPTCQALLFTSIFTAMVLFAGLM